MADKRVIEQTASTELYNDDWFLKDSVVEGTTKISAAKLKELLGADGTQALEEIANAIAEEYDSTHTYSLNDWVFHEGTLYRCIGNNVTGTWNATKWQAKTIKQFIADSENLITGRLLQMFGEYMPFSTLAPPSIEAISKGDIFIYQRTNRYKFYRAKADHPQGVTEFDIDDWDEFDTVADLIEDVAGIEIPVKDVQVKTDSTYDSVVDASGNAKIDLSSVTAYGEVPNLPQPIATFKDGADAPMKSLKVAIEPVQDLHGYDAPWVGGAGKNKLKYPYYGTSTTINGVTFTVNDDGTVKVNGTATADASFYLKYTGSDMILPSGDYIINGCPSGGANTTYMLNITNISTQDTGSGATFTSDGVTSLNIRIIIRSGFNAQDLLFKPMIRLASVSDATFAPYSNICPISGHTEANVTRTGENLWGGEKLADDIVAKVPNATKDATNKTISYSASYITGKILFTAFKPNTRYTFYMKSSSITNLYIYYTDGTNDYLSPNTVVTSDSGKSVDRIQGYWVTGYTTLNYEDCGVFEGVLTAQDFEPYNGNTYNIQFKDGDNPLTVYGGTLDVVSGELTVDRAYVKGVNVARVGQTGSGVPYADTTHIYADLVQNTTTISNRYVQINTSQSGENGNFRAYNGEFTIYDDRFTDITTAQSLLNDVEFCYELATPQTYQLTPTQVKSLLGSNNVWADTGDINDCIYQRDINTTINDIIARIEALEG